MPKKVLYLYRYLVRYFSIAGSVAAKRYIFIAVSVSKRSYISHVSSKPLYAMKRCSTGEGTNVQSLLMLSSSDNLLLVRLNLPFPPKQIDHIKMQC